MSIALALPVSLHLARIAVVSKFSDSVTSGEGREEDERGRRIWLHPETVAKTTMNGEVHSSPSMHWELNGLKGDPVSALITPQTSRVFQTEAPKSL